MTTIKITQEERIEDAAISLLNISNEFTPEEIIEKIVKICKFKNVNKEEILKKVLTRLNINN